MNGATALLFIHFLEFQSKTYNDVKEIIRTLHAEGKTILMTSHNYEDIETLCDEIYAIEDGQLGTLPADEMKRRFRG